MRIFSLLVALPLAACSFHSDASPPAAAAQGSGTTRTFPVTGFTGVELRGSDDVDVRVGSGFSVRAEGPSAELDTLEIVRVGDTLRVGRKSGGFSWGGDHDGVKVYVTMPRIVTADIAGSGNMTVDHVDGQTFSASNTGSGKLALATLGAAQAKLSIAGSGDIDAKGSVERLSVDVSGSGNVAASGLKASGADVSVEGSGEVHADVAGAASVSVAGSGDVDLGKRAKCTTSKTGSGEVRCGG